MGDLLFGVVVDVGEEEKCVVVVVDGVGEKVGTSVDKYSSNWEFGIQKLWRNEGHQPDGGVHACVRRRYLEK